MTSIELELTTREQVNPDSSGIDRAAQEGNDPARHDANAFEDTPPNGGYGWVCTFCVFFMIVHTWGINSAWGVILAHFLSHSTFPNTTQTEYAFIGGLSIGTALVMGPLVSQSQRVLGVTATLLFGTMVIFASLLGAAYARQISHLFLTQGICFGIGMGFVYLPAMSILPAWFSTRRSLSMGIAGSGSGVGGILYNLVAGYTVERFGWRTTYKILAFASLGANLLSSLLLRAREPSHHRPKRTIDHHDLRRPEVLLTLVWGIATELGYVTIFYSLPDYASSIGLTTQQGSVTGAILNLGLTIGRPLVGYISDKFGRITVPAILTAVCGLTCLAIWIPASSYSALLLFALVGGMVCGTFWGTITPVLAEVVGLGRLSSAFTLICLVLTVPTTVAEPIALSLVRGSSYLNTQVYVCCMFLLGAFGLWVLRSWKCYEVEKKASEEQEGLTSYGPSSFPSFSHWFGPRKLFIPGRV
ncbi:MFS general substrate transporter [Penicillium canariense]|uniref:MFS general substrate transporter n=1 Tax=Penicillium canariense TaxID=189055 RepID=A0A9W9IFR0_9EURO|nr:MFS general substrate transporter [Penicillium canariense]KAJ5175120.1 MFS general substrate transporter [Penicillium canariense]